MRKTSEVTDVNFPFADDRLPFILVLNVAENQSTNPALGAVPESDVLRGFSHARTGPKKAALLRSAMELSDAEIDCSVLAPWPGSKHTDVFLVDNLDEALAALG